MTKDCLLHWARRHLRWLLCFALLLPAAQLAGAVHALSHLNASTQHRDPGSPADLHCSICAVAAAVGAGGLPSTPLVLPADTTPTQRVLPAPLMAVHAAPQRRIANRGPPLLPA